VVEVGLEGGGAEDAFAAAGPGTRGREEGGFGVDGEEWVRGGRVGGMGDGRCFHGGRIAGVRGDARKMPGMNGTRLSGFSISFAMGNFLEFVAGLGQELVRFWSSFFCSWLPSFGSMGIGH